MDAPRFQIGDEVFVVVAGCYSERLVKCPLCAGTSYMTVLVGATGRKLKVNCDVCSMHDTNRGYMKVREPRAFVTTGTVNGVSKNVFDGQPPWRYDVTCGYIVDSLHNTRESAERAMLVRIPELVAERDAQVERNMLHSAKKATWSAYYSRREIKRAEATIAWHKKRLLAHKNLPMKGLD